VLEVGAGTGRNLPLYRTATRVVALEPDPGMRARANQAAQAAQVAVELIDGMAEHHHFPDATFDTVVASLVLCTVPDLAQTLAEARRVLRRSVGLNLGRGDWRRSTASWLRSTGISRSLAASPRANWASRRMERHSVRCASLHSTPGRLPVSSRAPPYRAGRSSDPQLKGHVRLCEPLKAGEDRPIRRSHHS
jgi:SAM-dependent methyltransferase